MRVCVVVVVVRVLGQFNPDRRLGCLVGVFWLGCLVGVFGWGDWLGCLVGVVRAS